MSTYVRHEAAIAKATDELGHTAELTAKWIDFSFRSVNQLGIGVALLLQDGGFVSSEDLRSHRQDPHVEAALTARSHAMSHVRAILIIDALGEPVAASEFGRHPPDDVAIKRLLAGLQDTASGRQLMLTPATDSGANVIYVAVRLAAQSGVATGAVIIVFDLSWFDAILTDIERSVPVSLSLDYTGTPGQLQRLVNSTLGPGSGEPVVSAAADAGSLGLTVSASRPRAQVLTPWIGDIWFGVILLAVWEILVIAGYGVARRWERLARRAQAAKAAALAAAREAEEEARHARIREKERAIEAIFDNDAVGFSEMSLPDRRFVRVNRRYCEITGRSAAELLSGLGPDNVYFPEDLPIFAATVDALRDKGSIARSLRYLRPDGTIVWVHVGVKVSAVDEAGQPTRTIAVVQDISDVKQAAEEVKERETLLRLSMQVGHIGTFWRRFGEDNLHLSDETCRILGLAEGTRLASYNSIERHMAEDDWVRIKREMVTARHGQTPEQAFSFRFVRPSDGVTRLLEVRVRHEYDADGRHNSTGVLIDVTETRKAEALLRLSLQISRIGTFRHDFVSQRIVCDATTRELYGLPPGDEPIPADAWWGYMLPEDRKSLDASLAADMAGHLAESRCDYRIRRPDDGSIRHFTVRVHLEYGTNGDLVSANGVIIDMTERYEAEARIAHLARHDVLTDLPNRLVLRERTDAAVAAARRGPGFALLMIDLDRFKRVNDTLGHPVGDALLQAVTERLSEGVRDTDTLTRLGGDEFAVLMPGLGEPREAAAIVADRIIASVGRPFHLGQHTIEIGASVGIAVAPNDGNETDDITKAADLALYRAKADGRGCWRFFEPVMDTDMRQRRNGEFDLRRALGEDEFDLVFQPMIELDSQRTVGIEAQMIWRHPERGPVAADAFANFAEELGILKDIGMRLLSRACAEAASWPGAPLLAYSVSSRQFYDRNFVASVVDALQSAHLPAERLELRIAEATLTSPKRDPRPILEGLSRFGIGLCIAEVGSDRSILGLLTHHRFDRIVVDGQFGSHAGADLAAIVATVSRLGDRVGSGCSVTGVETEAHGHLAERQGIRVAQGRLYAAPMSGTEIRSYLLDAISGRRRAV
ncbi:MAG: diguanylate cyclase [Ancalomicrobiaceae bacterium]|nr:diguanylate cyclase [Ancalomicrobiaceae bacterium]